MSRGAWWIAIACVVAVVPAVVYAAAGGRDYKPAASGNPCDARKWPSVNGTDEILQQAALSAIDGAACKLGVSSEALGLALTSQDRLDQFAKDNGITNSEVEQAARAGLLRAVDDGEASGEINGVTAFALRIAAQAVPIDRLIQLVRDQVYG
ncbi:MAG: hypothetical protein ACHQEA_15310 [Gaiellales bacterium]